MHVIECKRVDLWDGGDRQKFGFYINNDVSDAEIEKAHPHCHIEPTVLVVFDHLEQIDEFKAIELRRKVWDKLSPLERVAIGMKVRP